MSSVPTVPLPIDPTSLAAAQANQLASSTVMVEQLNDNLKAIYLTAFNNWKISVDAGRIPNTNPPQPPKAYLISSPDAAGFQWPVLGAGSVCDMPPVPVDHFTVPVKVPNTIDIGRNIGGSWFSVGPADTFPAGQKTPPMPDSTGALHIYERYGAPVGPGWYLQLS